MNQKQAVAHQALSYVQNGMVIGLGTGSTTGYFIDLLGESLRKHELRDILGVPTSIASAARAERVGIPLTNLARHPKLNLAVDGADEVDPNLNLIKGLGKALLREKIIEIHAERFIVIVDQTKLVERLGTRVPLPVEILPFEAEAHVRWLNTLGCRAELWVGEDRRPVITDNENYLARCWFDQESPIGIGDAYALARVLAERPGIIEHGLFLDMADLVIVAGITGVETRIRES